MTRQAGIFIVYICISLMSFPSQGQNADIISLTPGSASSQNAVNQIKFLYPDSAMSLYQIKIDSSLRAYDTITAIQAIVDKAYLNGHLSNYTKSYDGYWEALLLAENIKNPGVKGSIYNGLGWLYSLYGRYSDAIQYFNYSLRIFESEGGIEKHAQSLRDNYYALATLYRKKENIDTAMIYLDSCRSIIERQGLGLDIGNNQFLKAEIGYLLFKKGDLEAALKELEEAKLYFEAQDRSYLIILYSFLGKVYQSMNQLDEAESYFLNTLKVSEEYQSHNDLIPEIYESLSDVYVQKGDYKRAHQYLVESKVQEERQFSIRSKDNQTLLEIKDNYRIEKERKDDLIKEQRLAQLEQENRISDLKTIILIGAIISILILGFLFYRHLRTKYKAEKRFLQHQRALELEKANEVLNVKNKELTTSALHAVEREELLSEIKEELNLLRKDPNYIEVGKIVRHIDLNTSKSWEEFEVRFMAVNEGFYTRLKEKFPALTQSDHRLCALIKLNFSSKDMSRLMGISIESVHTTRYRLRKKLNLSRSENLEDFISTI
ncbi:MAG: tetratricopeptide repeat protein [Cyclobacteriaceae bacterium]